MESVIFQTTNDFVAQFYVYNIIRYNNIENGSGVCIITMMDNKKYNDGSNDGASLITITAAHHKNGL